MNFKVFFCSFLTFSILTLFAQPASFFQENSLLNSCWKKYSQSGEEGVLDAILQRLEIEQGFFIEFGGYDGITFSNTRFLAERGWPGAFIECNDEYMSFLRHNCKDLPNLKCIKEFVTSDINDKKGMTLDMIADKYFPDEEIDVLSIDVDGTDYLILESLERKPKVICIESSGYWHPEFQTKVPEHIAAMNLGQPLSVIIEIARSLGYEPICFLTFNLFLIRQDLYELFSDIKNDPVTLWLESWNHLGMYQPEDQKYITKRRLSDPTIRKYDQIPTPPLGCKEI